MLVCSCVLALLVAMASSEGVPNVILNNGKPMPAIALGTYLGIDQNDILKSKDVVRNAILRAVEAGYRHIDTAAIYETEAPIGDALKSIFEEGKVKREDMFITTKVWNTKHKKEEVAEAIKESMGKLGLDYVDLYLMHWPIGLNSNYTYSDVDYVETWRGLEDAAEAGLAKSIGVSNFNLEQLKKLLAEAKVLPAVLQIEVHPQLVQNELVDFCHSHNITVMGYSPLGTAVPRFGASLPGPKLDDPALAAVAGQHHKTSAQVLLRWQVERNIVPVIKSLNPLRLKENISIFDFKLTAEEMARITPNTTYRVIAPSFWQNHKDYPFEKVAEPVANPFLKQ